MSDEEGLSGQDFRGFPGFSLPFLLLPVEATYCSLHRTRDPACTNRSIFQPNTSTKWTPLGTANPLSAVGLSSFALEIGSVQPYGLSNVGIGRSDAQSPILSNRTIVGTDSKDFSMATFGLSLTAVSLGELGTSATFLARLVDVAQIPSASFSYTAGSSGQNISAKMIPPSLILGGYDKSRFDTSTVLSANFTTAATPDTFKFGVNLASIFVSSDSSGINDEEVFLSSNVALSGSSITVWIDPVLPQLWLPESVCKFFEKAFRLEWNDTAQLYLMNSSTHDWLIQSNRSVTFSLHTSNSNDDIKNFTLSSSAFDLRASWPLVEDDSYYFPLKRASGINVLGRTFLQETYMSVDYERGYFNLSQTTPWNGQLVDIRAVLNSSYDTYTDGNEPGAPAEAPAKSSGVSVGAYAGIGVGIAISVILIALLLSRKKRWWPFRLRRSTQESAVRHEFDKAELHGTALPWAEAMGHERAELQAGEHIHEVNGSGDVHGELPGSNTVHELDSRALATGSEDRISNNR